MLNQEQQRCKNKIAANKSSSDEACRSSEVMSSESLSGSSKKLVKDTTDKDILLYDSCRADSGFLSGTNLSGTISSEKMIVGEEIRPSSSSSLHSIRDTDKSYSKSYSRLDSGVDVGLSDQLSELCVDEEPIVDSLDAPSSEKIQDYHSHKRITTPTVPVEYFFEQDEDGDTKLHVAIMEGYVEAALKLIQMVPHSKYLDIMNDIRQTPLHLAVLKEQHKVVRRLVCAGANTMSADSKGNTPLHLAILAGDLASVQALTKPVTQHEALEAGVSYSNTKIISPDPDWPNYDGFTCVHLAAKGRHIQILNYLVMVLHADVNAKDIKTGYTALHAACREGNESLAKYLLDMKASHMVQTHYGLTPYGVSRQHTNILMLLLSYGASYEEFTDTEDEYDDDDDYIEYSSEDEC